MANSTPVWHNIFRNIVLKPDNIIFEAETYKDTLNIVRGPGVAWQGTSDIDLLGSTGNDTFMINVDYDISIPIATTKLSLEDVNGNLSEVNFKAGRGMVITRSSSQELQFESFSITETDTLHTITSRNNITSNKIFLNNIEVGTVTSTTAEDGFTGFDPGHDLIGNGTLSDPLRFSPLYLSSLDTNKTDDFTFTAIGPGTFSYQANYASDVTLSSASILLQREDLSSPGNWTTLDTVSGTSAGISYSISGIYSELHTGNVNYRLIFDWTNNTGTMTWSVYNTFEGGNYTPIDSPQFKTDTDAKTVSINDLQFFQNNISTISSNNDIVLTPHGAGRVIVSNDLKAASINDTPVGNVTSSTGAFTSLTANGSVTFTQDVPSTNTSTGTLVVTGGVGVSGKINTTDLEVTNTIIGSISGNAETVTNGVYITGSYVDPTWITRLDAAKIVGSIKLSDVTVDGDLKLFDNVVSTSLTNSDIVLDPNGTGKVRSLSNIVAPTFEGDVTGNVSGNAGTVTNGVYTTGSYADPTWITSLDGSKLTGTVVATNGVVTTGSYADPTWITSLDGSKLTGTVVATNGVVTTGSYADPTWITSLDASKISGSIRLSDITVDNNIKIYDNLIETTISNSDLELRANGTGVIFIPDGLTVTNAITFNTTTNNQSYTTTGTGTITISSGTLGSINNIQIGNTIRAAGNFTTLDANSTVGLSPANANVTISPTGTGTVTINPATASTMNNVTITVPAGTTSVAPFKITSGTNLSSPAAGAMEYDGTVLNFTTNTNVGRAPIKQIIFTSGIGQNNGNTIVASTNYPLFPVANDAITLPVGTYIVELSFRVDTSAAVSHALLFTILGGGNATCGFIGQASSTNTNTLPGTATQTRIASSAVNAITSVVATATQRVVFIKGILRVTVQGTIIPSIQFSGAAGTLTFFADNYMTISPIASSESVASIGNWG